jgi:hypothetical protein
VTASKAVVMAKRGVDWTIQPCVMTDEAKKRNGALRVTDIVGKQSA